MNKKILVVGGLGFIGSHFCNYLKNKNIDFEIYDINKPNGNPSQELINKRTNGIKEYITNDILNKNYEYVIHFGSLASPRSNNKDTDYFYNNNYLLLDLLNKIKFNRFVYISSSSVWGNIETPYSLSKKIAEQIISKLKNYAIIRPYTVYGKNGRPEMLISRCINNEFIMTNGKPQENYRYFTFVGDLVECIFNYAFVNKTNVAINAKGSKKYSIKEVLDIFNSIYEVGSENEKDFKFQIKNNDYDWICKTKIKDIKGELREY